MTRRVVFVCCDGFGRRWLDADSAPALARLASQSVWAGDHHAVFPSVTRVSAASIATGCMPSRHGLHGNRMGLMEAGRIVIRDAGAPDFRDHMRRSTGQTLRVPTIAERVAESGGFVAFSNVSPGAAYFLDPENFGHVYHRAGSFAAGGIPVPASEGLHVSHDLLGDQAMTERFCEEVLRQRKPAVSFLWLANPDLTLHGAPLGSPAHRKAMFQADECVNQVETAVENLRAHGEDILFLVGSDHGQETIGATVDLTAWLASQGLQQHIANGDIAVAGQGTAALLYATLAGRCALLESLDLMRAQPWAGDIVVGDELAQYGLAADGGIVAAVNMARRDEVNAFGVHGTRWNVAEPGKSPSPGDGQHGGWGSDEAQPFLLLNHPNLPASTVLHKTSLLDIAPTMLAFLGLASQDMDGSPIEATRSVLPTQSMPHATPVLRIPPVPSN